MPLKPLPLFHFEIQPGCHGRQSDGGNLPFSRQGVDAGTAKGITHAV